MTYSESRTVLLDGHPLIALHPECSAALQLRLRLSKEAAIESTASHDVGYLSNIWLKGYNLFAKDLWIDIRRD